MKVLALLLIFVYGAALTFILLYALAQLHLLVLYRRAHRPSSGEHPQPPGPLPVVTVQLPLFNERYVAERLLDCVARLDYPATHLEIQVLDDSTDETREIVDARVAYWRGQGIDMKAVRRSTRIGFKAGALQMGLEEARGEFLAIFDADFLPNPDFLKKTVPVLLRDKRIGVVQTRWEHLNPRYSLFTRTQAFALDAHFTVEQTGRNHGDYYINFNGTAGIWRKETIHDAGGWQSDTLTEDLDLSYRAQLRGWKFRYLETVASPAELPAEMNAIKSQQFRWTKGAAETARKLYGQVWRSPIPFPRKVHAFFHLFNSSIFICILVCALLSVPALWFKSQNYYPLVFQLAPLFLGGLLIIGAVYYTAFRKRCHSTREALLRFIPMFPMFLSLSMGLSLHNAIAVAEGFLGRKTAFIRTPKFALVGNKGHWGSSSYRRARFTPIMLVEGALMLYFGLGIWLGVLLGDFGLLPFHVMLLFGFGSIFFYTLWHLRPAR